MEERKRLSFDLMFGLWLENIKQVEIPCEFVQEDEGGWACFTNMLNMHGIGDTREECMADLISGFRDSTYAYVQNLPYWVKERPDELPYILKVLISTDEELISCLRGVSSLDG